VVQEEALIEALRAKADRGAMLDVYEHYRLEPGIRCSRWTTSSSRRTLRPSRRNRARGRASRAADEMLRILRGEQPRNLVNPEV
jgi:phosphoglycerate dehydrogenase-like enzyme